MLLPLLALGCHSPPDSDAVGMESVRSRGVVRCAGAESRREEGFETLSSGDWADRPGGPAWGAATGDLDDDGWLDVVLPTGAGMRVYLGGPNGFVDASEALPSEARDPEQGWHAASVADADDDGDLDVYLGGGGQSMLLYGDGAGGVERWEWLLDGKSYGGVWGDLDGDGDLDLVVANSIDVDTPGIYEAVRDEAGTTFVHRPEWVPEDFWVGMTFAVGVMDLDGDRLPELYRGNDIANHVGNALAWNRGGGRFEADNGAAGLDVDICTMGLGVGDINGDELPDLAMSDCEDLWLFESTSFGVWVDASAARGFRIDPAVGKEVPWGIDFGDLNNDGELDAYVAYGFLGSQRTFSEIHEQPDGVYLLRDGEFSEVSQAWNIDEIAATRGVVLADLDNDGWLDALAANNSNERSDVHLSTCGDAAWLEVELRQDPPNRRAVGAKVRFVTDDLSVVRWVQAGGSGLASGGPNDVHAGLGDADRVTVEVEWPDGSTTTHGPMPTRQRILVER